MARSTKPRRPYRQRYAPGHILLPSQRDQIALPAHTALACIEMGAGQTEHRHSLAAFLNVAATLSVKLRGTQLATRDLVKAGQDALVSADRRFLASGRWGLSGPEMLAIRAAVTAGDELLKRANSAILQFCIRWVYDINEASPAIYGTADAPLGVAA